VTLLARSLPTGWLIAVEQGWVPVRRAWLVWMVNGVVQGTLFWIVFLVAPHLRPDYRHNVIPIFQRSLSARFMIIIIPLLIVGLIVSVVAVSERAVTLAREQVLDEMTRSAANAGDGIVNFFYTGANLLDKFAADETLLDPEVQEIALERDRQIVPFFQELLLVDADGTILAYVPQHLPALDLVLTEEETTLLDQAVDFKISLRTHLTSLPSGAKRMTFIQPILPGDDQERVEGVLLGRVQLDVNPNMERALNALQSTRGVGEGFVVDDRDLIIAHPNEDAILRPWASPVDVVDYPSEVGRAYESVGEQGQQLLSYTRAVEGAPSMMVMQLPFSIILETATLISSPLLLVQLVISLLLLVVIPVLATRITRPLHTLADATKHIAQGDLSFPVHISGADEVAQLGRAFEQMRLRLRARLTDLSLLLNVSQSVSATLDLEEGVPLILKGALEETEAAVARFVLLEQGSNQPRHVFSVGESHESFSVLDRAFTMALYRRRTPLLDTDFQREEITPLVIDALQSVAAFPVRTHNRTVAVLWVGSQEQDAFDEAKINFLNTLASQAAVLVENARLFQAAEGGRQRLAAILASTTDAILVTDAELRVLLINPAAERVLGLDETAYGRPITALELPEPLVETLMRSLEEEQGILPAVEVPLLDGRTFYASIAPIMTGQRQRTGGRVMVMRDITHFKELDEMKSDFVATVSHDLRAPLTFIRGYATMLAMVGDLNDKQQEYLDRILEGIEQMSSLIGDLLNLRRIEAGVGIKRDPCPLGVILVEAVDTMRARATTKAIHLQLEPADGAPVVTGDRTLLRQAFGNLVDNAIKYTPTGGEVSVGLRVNHKDEEVVVHIADTGIGIAPEDQVRLFEKFHRIKRRETSNISGTGLGLALVKSIVERHKGRVWVESDLDVGSTFYVALPLRNEDED
ncbi:MAG: ATP-binding protein, partial [Anaerolineae bacterium]